MNTIYLIFGQDKKLYVQEATQFCVRPNLRISHWQLRLRDNTNKRAGYKFLGSLNLLITYPNKKYSKTIKNSKIQVVQKWDFKIFFVRTETLGKNNHFLLMNILFRTLRPLRFRFI